MQICLSLLKCPPLYQSLKTGLVKQFATIHTLPTIRLIIVDLAQTAEALYSDVYFVFIFLHMNVDVKPTNLSTVLKQT